MNVENEERVQYVSPSRLDCYMARLVRKQQQMGTESRIREGLLK